MGVVRYLYDIDNNGILDKNDFKCLAVRNTIVEAKGDFPADRFAANCKIMDDLWNEIACLADFDKNGEVDVDEFKAAVQVNCVGKTYAQFPPMFKAFIENQFKTIDVDGDGTVGLDEFLQFFSSSILHNIISYCKPFENSRLRKLPEHIT